MRPAQAISITKLLQAYQKAEKLKKKIVAQYHTNQNKQYHTNQNKQLNLKFQSCTLTKL